MVSGECANHMTLSCDSDHDICVLAWSLVGVCQLCKGAPAPLKVRLVADEAVDIQVRIGPSL